MIQVDVGPVLFAFGWIGAILLVAVALSIGLGLGYVVASLITRTRFYLAFKTVEGAPPRDVKPGARDPAEVVDFPRFSPSGSRISHSVSRRLSSAGSSLRASISRGLIGSNATPRDSYEPEAEKIREEHARDSHRLYRSAVLFSQTVISALVSILSAVVESVSYVVSSGVTSFGIIFTIVAIYLIWTFTGGSETHMCAWIENTYTCSVRPFAVSGIMPTWNTISIFYQAGYGAFYFVKETASVMISASVSTAVFCTAPSLIKLVPDAGKLVYYASSDFTTWLGTPGAFDANSNVTLNVNATFGALNQIVQQIDVPIACICEDINYAIEPVIQDFPELYPAVQSAVDAAVEIFVKFPATTLKMAANVIEDPSGYQGKRSSSGNTDSAYAERVSRARHKAAQRRSNRNADPYSRDVQTARFTQRHQERAYQPSTDYTTDRPTLKLAANKTSQALILAGQWADKVAQDIVSRLTLGYVLLPPVTGFFTHWVAFKLVLIGTIFDSVIRLDYMVKFPADFADTYLLNDAIFEQLYMHNEIVQGVADAVFYDQNIGGIIIAGNLFELHAIRSLAFGGAQFALSLGAQALGQISAIDVANRIDATVDAAGTFALGQQTAVQYGAFIQDVTFYLYYSVPLACTVESAMQTVLNFLYNMYVMARMITLSFCPGALPASSGGLGGAFVSAWSAGNFSAVKNSFYSLSSCAGQLVGDLTILEEFGLLDISDPITYGLELGYQSAYSLFILGFDGACVTASQASGDSSVLSSSCYGGGNFGQQLVHSWDSGLYDGWYSSFALFIGSVGGLPLLNYTGTSCVVVSAGDIVTGILQDATQVGVSFIDCLSKGDSDTVDCYIQRYNASLIFNTFEAMYGLGDCLKTTGDYFTGGANIGLGTTLRYAVRTVTSALYSLVALLTDAFKLATTSAGPQIQQSGSFSVFMGYFSSDWYAGAFSAFWSDLSGIGIGVGQFVGNAWPALGCTITNVWAGAVYVIRDTIDVAVQFSLPNQAFVGQSFFIKWYAGGYNSAGDSIIAAFGCVGSFLDTTIYGSLSPSATGFRCLLQGVGSLAVAIFDFVAQILVLSARSSLDPSYMSSGGYRGLIVQGWSNGTLSGIPTVLEQLSACNTSLGQEVGTPTACVLSSSIAAVAGAVNSTGAFFVALFNSNVTSSVEAFAATTQLYAQEDFLFAWLDDVGSAAACALGFFANAANTNLGAEVATPIQTVVIDGFSFARATLNAGVYFLSTAVTQGYSGGAPQYSLFLYSSFFPRETFTYNGSVAAPPLSVYIQNTATPGSAGVPLSSASFVLLESRDSAPGTSPFVVPFSSMCRLGNSIGVAVHYYTALVPALLVSSPINMVVGLLSDITRWGVLVFYSVVPASTPYNSIARPTIGELASSVMSANELSDMYFYAVQDLAPAIGSLFASFASSPETLVNNTVLGDLFSSKRSTAAENKDVDSGGDEEGHAQRSFSVSTEFSVIDAAVRDLVIFGFVAIRTLPQLFADVTLVYGPGASAASLINYSPSVGGASALGAIADSVLAGRYAPPFTALNTFIQDVENVGTDLSTPVLSPTIASAACLARTAVYLAQDTLDGVSLPVQAFSYPGRTFYAGVKILASSLGTGPPLRNSTDSSKPTLRRWYAGWQQLTQQITTMMNSFGIVQSSAQCFVSNALSTLTYATDLLGNLAGALCLGIGDIADTSPQTFLSVSSAIFNAFQLSFNNGLFSGPFTWFSNIVECFTQFIIGSWNVYLAHGINAAANAAVDFIQALISLTFSSGNALLTGQPLAAAINGVWQNSAFVSGTTTQIKLVETYLGAFLAVWAPQVSCLPPTGLELLRSVAAGVVQALLTFTKPSYASENGGTVTPNIVDAVSIDWNAGVFNSTWIAFESLDSCVQTVVSVVSPTMGSAVYNLGLSAENLVESVIDNVILIAELFEGFAAHPIPSQQTNVASIVNYLSWVSASLQYSAPQHSGMMLNYLRTGLANAVEILTANVDVLQPLVFHAVAIPVELLRTALVFTVTFGSGAVQMFPSQGDFAPAAPLIVMYDAWITIPSTGIATPTYTGGGELATQLYIELNGFTGSLSTVVASGGGELQPFGAVATSIMNFAIGASQFVIHATLSSTGGWASGVYSSPLAAMSALYDAGTMRALLITPLETVVDDIGAVVGLADVTIGCFVSSVGTAVVTGLDFGLGVLFNVQPIVTGQSSIEDVAPFAAFYSSVQDLGTCFQTFFFRFSPNGCSPPTQVYFFCCLGQVSTTPFGFLADLLQKAVVTLPDCIFMRGYSDVQDLLNFDALIADLSEFLGGIACMMASLFTQTPNSSACSTSQWQTNVQNFVASVLDLLLIIPNLANDMLKNVLLLTSASSFGNLLDQIVNDIADPIIALLNGLAGVLNCFFSGAGVLFSTMATILQGMVTIIDDFLGVFLDFLQVVIDIFEGSSSFGNDLGTFFTALFGAIGSLITQIVDAILNDIGFGNLINFLDEIASFFTNTVCGGLLTGINDMLNFFTESGQDLDCLKPGCLHTVTVYNYGACSSCDYASGCRTSKNTAQCTSNNCIAGEGPETCGAISGSNDCSSCCTGPLEPCASCTGGSSCFGLCEIKTGSSNCYATNGFSCSNCIVGDCSFSSDNNQCSSSQCYQDPATQQCGTETYSTYCDSSCLTAATTLPQLSLSICQNTNFGISKRSLRNEYELSQRRPSTFVRRILGFYNEPEDHAGVRSAMYQSRQGPNLRSRTTRSATNSSTSGNSTFSSDSYSPLLNIVYSYLDTPSSYSTLYGRNVSLGVFESGIDSYENAYVSQMSDMINYNVANNTERLASLILNATLLVNNSAPYVYVGYAGLLAWNGKSECDNNLNYFFGLFWQWDGVTAENLPVIPPEVGFFIKDCSERRLFAVTVGAAIGWITMPQDFFYNWMSIVTTGEDVLVGIVQYVQCFQGGLPCATNMTAYAEVVAAAGVQTLSAPVYFLGLGLSLYERISNFSYASVLINAIPTLGTSLTRFGASLTNLTASAGYAIYQGATSNTNASISSQISSSYGGMNALLNYATATVNDTESTYGDGVNITEAYMQYQSDSYNSTGASSRSVRRGPRGAPRSVFRTNLESVLSEGNAAFWRDADKSSPLLIRGPRALALDIMHSGARHWNRLVDFASNYSENATASLEQYANSSDYTMEERLHNQQKILKRIPASRTLSPRPRFPVVPERTADPSVLSTDFMTKVQRIPRRPLQKPNPLAGVDDVTARMQSASRVADSAIRSAFMIPQNETRATTPTRQVSERLSPRDSTRRTLNENVRARRQEAPSESTSSAIRIRTSARVEMLRARWSAKTADSSTALSTDIREEEDAPGDVRSMLRFYSDVSEPLIDSYVGCAAASAVFAGVGDVLLETVFYYSTILSPRLQYLSPSFTDPEAYYSTRFVEFRFPTVNQTIGGTQPLLNAVFGTTSTDYFVDDENAATNFYYSYGAYYPGFDPDATPPTNALAATNETSSDHEGVDKAGGPFDQIWDAAYALFNRLIDWDFADWIADFYNAIENSNTESISEVIEASSLEEAESYFGSLASELSSSCGRQKLANKVESTISGIYNSIKCDRTANLDCSGRRMSVIQGAFATTVVILLAFACSYVAGKVLGGVASTLMGTGVLIAIIPLFGFFTYGTSPLCTPLHIPACFMDDVGFSVMRTVFPPRWNWNQQKMTQSWPPPAPWEPLPPSWSPNGDGVCDMSYTKITEVDAPSSDAAGSRSARSTDDSCPAPTSTGTGKFFQQRTIKGTQPSEYASCYSDAGFDSVFAPIIFLLRWKAPSALEWLSESNLSGIRIFYSSLGMKMKPYIDQFTFDKAAPRVATGASPRAAEYLESLIAGAQWPSADYPAGVELDFTGVQSYLVTEPVDPPLFFTNCFYKSAILSMAVFFFATGMIIYVGVKIFFAVAAFAWSVICAIALAIDMSVSATFLTGTLVQMDEQCALREMSRSAEDHPEGEHSEEE